MEGDPQGAHRETEARRRHDSHSASAEVARAEALLLLDKPEEGRKALLRAVDLDPTSALAYARLALLEFATERTLAAKLGRTELRLTLEQEQAPRLVGTLLAPDGLVRCGLFHSQHLLEQTMPELVESSSFLRTGRGPGTPLRPTWQSSAAPPPCGDDSLPVYRSAFIL
jgi:hypothetical protein